MELQAIVEALLGELDEVADVDGRILAVKLDANRALIGGDDGDFLAIRLIFRRVQSHDSS